MTRQCVVRLLAVAIAGAATSTVTLAQDPRPDESELPAVRLRVDTLAAFINHVAGLRVRVVHCVVDEIASPRVFMVRNQRSMRHFYRPAAAAIVIISGQAVQRRGAAVVVTGIARTRLGAELSRDQPLPALTDEELEAIAELPVIVASSVETPGGVNLLRPER